MYRTHRDVRVTQGAVYSMLLCLKSLKDKCNFLHWQLSIECKWNLNQASGEFSSPYFPSNYHNFQDCQWNITAPRDHVIRLQFGVFELESNPSSCGNNRCGCDYVDIRQESLKGDLTTLGRYCATISSLPIIQSSTNKMIVTFHSDHVITAKGFNASYMTVPKLAGWILLAN